MAEMYSMVQFYGLPTWFITISPGESCNELIMALCVRQQWAQCESDANGKVPKEFRWSTVIDGSMREKLAANDPAAAALYFDELLEIVLRHLLGVNCGRVNAEAISEAKALGKLFGCLLVVVNCRLKCSLWNA